MRESEFGNLKENQIEIGPSKQSTAGETIRQLTESFHRHAERFEREGARQDERLKLETPNALHLEDMLIALAEEFHDLELSPIQEKLLDATIDDLSFRTVGELKEMHSRNMNPQFDRNDADPFLRDHINASILQIYGFLHGIKTGQDFRLT